MTLLIFLLILSVLVLVHEFGHFIVAKKLGIRVEEFGLGIPPRIFGKQIGETLYSLNLLPFGGFVKVTGEDSTDENASKDPRSFAVRPPWQRIAVLGAGVFMNFVLAVVVFYGVLAADGYKTQYIPLIFEHNFRFGHQNVIGTVVSGMLTGSSAEKSGIQLGEAILTVDNLPIKNVYDLRDSLKGKLNQDVTVRLKDIRNSIDGPVREVVLKPQADDQGNVILGVYVSKAVSLEYTSQIDKAFAGFLHTYNVMAYSLSTFGNLIGLSYAEKTITPVSQSVAGPVGIYQLVGGLIEYGGSKVILRLLDFTALMSVSLAFMNILPIPALDGGRILFVIVEKIKGKPISPKIEALLHQWGFIILIGILVLVSIKDILH